MTLGLVWAQDRSGTIGRDGVLPWHLPEDLAHFRDLTMGYPVIMGRRTWESIPERFRPLPDRRNIVVTRQLDWQADGATVVNSVPEALSAAGPDAWVIGGGEIYSATIHVADLLEVTEIDDVIDGTTRAPAIGSEWTSARVDPTSGWHTSRSGHRFRWVRYLRAD